MDADDSIPGDVRVSRSVMGELFGTRDKKAKTFVVAMDDIRKEELKRIVDYLCPLVDCINYCQSNSAISMEVLPVIERLRAYYTNRDPLGISREQVKNMFDKRFNMFDDILIELSSLFIETPRPVDARSPEVQARFNRIQKEIKAL